MNRRSVALGLWSRVYYNCNVQIYTKLNLREIGLNVNLIFCDIDQEKMGPNWPKKDILFDPLQKNSMIIVLTSTTPCMIIFFCITFKGSQLVFLNVETT